MYMIAQDTADPDADGGYSARCDACSGAPLYLYSAPSTRRVPVARRSSYSADSQEAPYT